MSLMSYLADTWKNNSVFLINLVSQTFGFNNLRFNKLINLPTSRMITLFETRVSMNQSSLLCFYRKKIYSSIRQALIHNNLDFSQFYNCVHNVFEFLDLQVYFLFIKRLLEFESQFNKISLLEFESL